MLHKSAGDVQAATEPCEKGFVHNAACTGSWQPTAEGVHLTVEFEHQQHSNHSGHDGDNKSTSSSTSTLWDPDRFCYGGTSMYMDGFHWVHDSLCVIYLFPGWVLSTKAKLAAASVGTVVMAALLEGIIWQRRELLRTLPAGGLRLSVGSLLYGVQLSLGYLVMLVIMTYSGVLFLCTVTGLVLGNVLFNAKDGLMASRRRENPQEESAAHGIPADGDHQFDKDGDLPMKSAPCGCEDKAYTVESGNAPSDHDIPDGATPCCQHAS